MTFQNIINNIQFSELNQQTFTTSGTYTPTPGMSYCIVTMVGGGGAGGGNVATGATSCSAGAGGGAGAYIQAFYTSQQIGVSQTINVGTGGTGVVGGNGGSGGNTFMGGFILCNGGTGGNAGGLNTGLNGFALPGNGGAAIVNGGTPLLQSNGQNGETSSFSGTPNFAFGGSGGSTKLGNSISGYLTIGGGIGPTNSLYNNFNYGAGGAGSCSSRSRPAQAGVDGSPGYVYILEFIG